MCTTDDTLINAFEFTTVFIKGIVIDLLLIGVVNAVTHSEMTCVGGQGGQTNPPGETLIPPGKDI